MRLHQLECTAIDMLRHASPRILLIDEVQNLLSCGARDHRAALNAIKHLGNKLRFSVVAAGTHVSLHVMRSDPQISSRFEQFKLPIRTESQEFRRSIEGYLVRCKPPRMMAYQLRCASEGMYRRSGMPYLPPTDWHHRILASGNLCDCGSRLEPGRAALAQPCNYDRAGVVHPAQRV
jgi:hypothetical protein